MSDKRKWYTQIRAAYVLQDSTWSNIDEVVALPNAEIIVAVVVHVGTNAPYCNVDLV